MTYVETYKKKQNERLNLCSKIHSELFNLYTGLGIRHNTFKAIFKYLDNIVNPTIVETGIIRSVNNYSGDGHSTLLLDEYLHFFRHSGSLTTIDINELLCEFAKPLLSTNSTIICSDSVTALTKLGEDVNFPSIDLLYLDSYDLNWNDPHNSALHHFKELFAISPKLKKGTLIVVDDHDHGKGKGKYIADYMNHINKSPYFDEYQIGWLW